jgi:CDP-glucose 4,6-dehydratase
VDAYIHLAEATEKLNINGEAFNFSNDHPLTVFEIHKAIYQAAGKHYQEPLIQNTAKSEILNQHLDSSKAKSILGWSSKLSLDDGLRITADWYSNFLRKTK